MSFVLDGINFDVVHEGALQGVYQGNGVATLKMVYIVQWDDRWNAIAALLGYPPGPSFMGDKRDPHSIAGSPIIVRCSAVELKGLGKPTIVDDEADVAWPEAILTATYGQPENSGGIDFPPPPGFEDVPNFGSYSMDFSTEMVTGGRNQYRFASDGEPTDQTTGKFIALIEHNLTLNAINATINTDVVSAAMGKVNGAQYIGKAAGTLLFLGVSTQRNLGTTQLPLSITVRIVERPVGWNKVYRPSSASGFEDVLPAPYQFTDFATLFNGVFT